MQKVLRRKSVKIQLETKLWKMHQFSLIRVYIQYFENYMYSFGLLMLNKK